MPAPEGWLAGSGLWTPDGVLRLPYATDEVPCGVAELAAPWGEPVDAGLPGGTAAPGPGGTGGPGGAGPEDPVRDGTAPGAREASAEAAEPEPPGPVVARPVPLQQAPLGRLVTN